MSKNKSIIVLSLATLLLAPTAVLAVKKQTFVCGSVHQVRQGGLELTSTALGLRNADLTNPMTVERITIRNVFGAVVHDSGPAAGVPHPLNTDFVTPLDITVVPPGASYYLRTPHIWGNFSLPPISGGNEGGQSMTATIEVSKKGKKNLAFIGANARARERLTSPTGVVTEGAERSRTGLTCEALEQPND